MKTSPRNSVCPSSGCREGVSIVWKQRGRKWWSHPLSSFQSFHFIQLSRKHSADREEEEEAAETNAFCLQQQTLIVFLGSYSLQKQLSLRSVINELTCWWSWCLRASWTIRAADSNWRMASRKCWTSQCISISARLPSEQLPQIRSYSH